MLGAYEPLGERLAVLATIVSLFILFKPQWRGTSKIGGFFGWFMLLVWFPWIAIKGLPWAIRHPEVMAAVNPLYGLQFLASFPQVGAFVMLGVVVLAITGGEAKYADIGHFARRGDHEVPEGQSLAPADSGRRPVMYSWFFLVWPCLLLNYAGQFGYLLMKGYNPTEARAFMDSQQNEDGRTTVADAMIYRADKDAQTKLLLAITKKNGNHSRKASTNT
jgi:KUP system potassium uptake protein